MTSKFVYAVLVAAASAMDASFFAEFELMEEARGHHVLSLLQQMISFTNSTHDPESFLEYGCWCASNPNARRHDLTKGRSLPVDPVDNVCRSTAYCHMCLKIDHDQDCNFYQAYNHTLTSYGLECHDEEGSCGWAACQCDAKFIEDMAFVQELWKPEHNMRGGFDFNARCLQPRRLTVPFDKCCGYEPDRYPYKSHGGQKSCCGSQIYDTTYLKCCEMTTMMNETTHGTTLQSNECSILAQSKSYVDGFEIPTL